MTTAQNPFLAPKGSPQVSSIQTDSFGAQNPASAAGIGALDRLGQPRLPHECGRCRQRWGGFNTSHCSAEGCHRTFTSLTAFDKHRTGSHAYDTRTCLSPEGVGLVDAGRSYPCWGMPSDGADWVDALEGGAA